MRAHGNMLRFKLNIYPKASVWLSENLFYQMKTKMDRPVYKVFRIHAGFGKRSHLKRCNTDSLP